MKIILILAVMSLSAGALFAQTPAQKPKPAAEKKPAAVAAEPAPAAVAAAPAKKPAARPEPAKPAAKPQEEPEESMVMIDTRTDPEDVRGAASAPEGAGAAAPKVLPSVFGQFKGVLNDGGRNLLLFENPDSGDIFFVQVTFGKGGVSWRLLDSLKRYGAESMAGGMDSDFN